MGNYNVDIDIATKESSVVGWGEVVESQHQKS